ncbi:conserved hypothetical protein [Ricinus communis]|uniref:Reverse transcriptase domain-containing protein n=1 Tax=Ricinus communis TaxID=3988 RepID=B9SRH7_RICCO|nr:conserved hypothetical protein [Ricinus communis]
MARVFTRYFSVLFTGSKDVDMAPITESVSDRIPMDMKAVLQEPYNKEEVLAVLRQMHPNKYSVPDDDSLLFGRANVKEAEQVLDILNSCARASGQQINLDKCIISFNRNVNEYIRQAIQRVMGVKHVQVHGKYCWVWTSYLEEPKHVLSGLLLGPLGLSI